jgi:hypothetical protein
MSQVPRKADVLALLWQIGSNEETPGYVKVKTLGKLLDALEEEPEGDSLSVFDELRAHRAGSTVS